MLKALIFTMQVAWSDVSPGLNCSNPCLNSFEADYGQAEKAKRSGFGAGGGWGDDNQGSGALWDCQDGLGWEGGFVATVVVVAVW